jgi:hypothetical protein
MRHLPLIATIVALTLGAGSRLNADQAASTADPLAGFDAYVTQAVKDWKTTGLAVAVV